MSFTYYYLVFSITHSILHIRHRSISLTEVTSSLHFKGWPHGLSFAILVEFPGVTVQLKTAPLLSSCIPSMTLQGSLWATRSSYFSCLHFGVIILKSAYVCQMHMWMCKHLFSLFWVYLRHTSIKPLFSNDIRGQLRCKCLWYGVVDA